MNWFKKVLSNIFVPKIIKVVAAQDFYRDYEDEAILEPGDYQDMVGEDPSDNEDVLQLRKGDRLVLEKAGSGTDLRTEDGEHVCRFPMHFRKKDFKEWGEYFKREDKASDLEKPFCDGDTQFCSCERGCDGCPANQAGECSLWVLKHQDELEAENDIGEEVTEGDNNQ